MASKDLDDANSAAMSVLKELDIFAGLLNSSQNPDPNSSNKRLHIKLCPLQTDITRYMIRKWWGGRQTVENTLGRLWTTFGSPSDTFYSDDFSFCFVSFSTHEEAAAAKEKLNDKAQLYALAIAIVKRQEGDTKGQKITSQILSHLIVDAIILSQKRASWAKPRRSRDEYDRWSIDEPDFFDDCPDGIDRHEWDEYCAGRD
eukprot:scaffold24_cov128-Cylindrotheca_fusiformis.AAC.3